MKSDKQSGLQPKALQKGRREMLGCRVNTQVSVKVGYWRGINIHGDTFEISKCCQKGLRILTIKLVFLGIFVHQIELFKYKRIIMVLAIFLVLKLHLLYNIVFSILSTYL